MPARFVTDSSLDLVARRLRTLGFDVLTVRGARLEELFETARLEQRTVLTLSTRHPRRYADVATRAIDRADPAAAIRAIAASEEPSGPPFSRCPICNTPLERRHPLEATGEVPGRVLRTARALAYCPSCGKWYWDGSHVARLREWLAEAVGREVPGPEPRERGPSA